MVESGGRKRRSGKRDSNPRPLAWEANALPTELLPLLTVQLIYFFIYFSFTFLLENITQFADSTSLTVFGRIVEGKAKKILNVQDVPNFVSMLHCGYTI